MVIDDSWYSTKMSEKKMSMVTFSKIKKIEVSKYNKMGTPCYTLVIRAKNTRCRYIFYYDSSIKDWVLFKNIVNAVNVLLSFNYIM